jgi:hypothetical protein
MANTIKLKKSSVPAKSPQVGDLDFGELAINYADGNLFFKTANNVIATLSSTQFVSVSGNVTGGNIFTAGNVSATGNVHGNYIVGNGRALTGINSISDGTSNVVVVAASGNVVVAVGGVADTAIFGQGSFYVQGPMTTPRVLNTSAAMADGVNGIMIGPLTLGNAANISIPDGSALTIFEPSNTDVDGGDAELTFIT